MTTESGETTCVSSMSSGCAGCMEKFILEYYAQNYGLADWRFSSRALQIPWQLDDGYDALLPVMQTDITLTYGNRS